MFLDYILFILSNFLSKVLSSLSINANLLLTLRPSFVKDLVAFLGVLKYSTALRLNTLVELTAFDSPSNKCRFTINLILASIEYNYRFLVNFKSTGVIDSLMPVFINSNWCERELRDMFGIFFKNNPDLRRLLTDYGFEGFPLRKDFPLTGYFEVRYDDDLQHILYEPLHLSQEFRVFSISSPWEDRK